MKDAEQLRKEYNERFSGSLNLWASEDIDYCLVVAKRILKISKLNPSKNLSLLDVGCATGYFTKAFSLLGFEANGLDYSEVAISKASILHPDCKFIHCDGFNPILDKSFDLIFCKGFSGANTHDLNFVANWANKYIKYLNPGGIFVFSYTSNFSGTEVNGETANWSKKEIKSFIDLIDAPCTGITIFYRFGVVSRIIVTVKRIIFRKKIKRYFYIFFKTEA